MIVRLPVRILHGCVHGTNTRTTYVTLVVYTDYTGRLTSCVVF